MYHLNTEIVFKISANIATKILICFQHMFTYIKFNHFDVILYWTTFSTVCPRKKSDRAPLCTSVIN